MSSNIARTPSSYRRSFLQLPIQSKRIGSPPIASPSNTTMNRYSQTPGCSNIVPAGDFPAKQKLYIRLLGSLQELLHPSRRPRSEERKGPSARWSCIIVPPATVRGLVRTQIVKPVSYTGIKSITSARMTASEISHNANGKRPKTQISTQQNVQPQGGSSVRGTVRRSGLRSVTWANQAMSWAGKI